MKHQDSRPGAPTGRGEAQSGPSDAPTLELPNSSRVGVTPLNPRSAAETLRAFQPVSFRESGGEPRLGLEMRGALSTDPRRRERLAPMDLMVIVMRVVQDQQRSIALLQNEVLKLRSDADGAEGSPTSADGALLGLAKD